jgi:hypothetical protein
LAQRDVMMEEKVVGVCYSWREYRVRHEVAAKFEDLRARALQLSVAINTIHTSRHSDTGVEV